MVIPPQFSRDVYAQARPRIGLVLDNTDNFMTSTFRGPMQQLVDALNQPEVQPRVVQQITLQVVELYPYIEYMKYLLPGSITLAMFVSVMIGGGIVYIDDKARGVHEGYLVTPITKVELVGGIKRCRCSQSHGGRHCAYGPGIVDCRRGIYFPAGKFFVAVLTHRCYFIRIHLDDVCDDGARKRSAYTARHFRHSEYFALFSQRRYLSDPGVS